MLALPQTREEISMPLDDQVRQTAEALAADFGRELQQRLGQFVETVLNEAAAERDALNAQAAFPGVAVLSGIRAARIEVGVENLNTDIET